MFYFIQFLLQEQFIPLFVLLQLLLFQTESVYVALVYLFGDMSLMLLVLKLPFELGFLRHFQLLHDFLIRSRFLLLLRLHILLFVVLHLLSQMLIEISIVIEPLGFLIGSLIVHLFTPLQVLLMLFKQLLSFLVLHELSVLDHILSLFQPLHTFNFVVIPYHIRLLTQSGLVLRYILGFLKCTLSLILGHVFDPLLCHQLLQCFLVISSLLTDRLHKCQIVADVIEFLLFAGFFQFLQSLFLSHLPVQLLMVLLLPLFVTHLVRDISFRHQVVLLFEQCVPFVNHSMRIRWVVLHLIGQHFLYMRLLSYHVFLPTISFQFQCIVNFHFIFKLND